MRKFIFKFGWVIILLVFQNCKECPPDEPGGGEPTIGDLENIDYNPTPYELPQLMDFPQMVIPDDNPITDQGVLLGRMLFFDPILSVDSSMSCASCHLAEQAFADGQRFSRGVEGGFTARSSMAIMNVGFIRHGLFWDGRSATLEDQALLPVEDEIELHEEWPNVVEKFKRHADYPTKFREAFGITSKSEITKELAAKAIAQFERTMIVGAGSKFYKYWILNDGIPSDEEFNGHAMFFDASRGDLPDAQCFHCHASPLFTDIEFRNNGLDSVANVADFPDLGRGGVTNFEFDNGKFAAPTLWNIELTAPYMHDGRFRTLEEVIDHYASGGHWSPNRDALMDSISLDAEQKADLVAFLKTLTDTSFINNPAFQDPFK